GTVDRGEISAIIDQAAREHPGKRAIPVVVVEKVVVVDVDHKKIEMSVIVIVHPRTADRLNEGGVRDDFTRGDLLESAIAVVVVERVFLAANNHTKVPLIIVAPPGPPARKTAVIRGNAPLRGGELRKAGRTIVME